MIKTSLYENESVNLYDYPTKEEYLNNVHDIQEKELKSDRFKNVCTILNTYYWNRSEKELEKQLFKIVGSYGIENKLINKSKNYIQQHRFARFLKLKQFLNSLTDEQINSNIFLKRAKEYMYLSIEECKILLQELIIKMNDLQHERNTRIHIEVLASQKSQEIIPVRVFEMAEIKSYRPQESKVAYVDVLPINQKSIYVDYNTYVDKLNCLAKDIYSLQMNLLVSMFPDEIFNYDFKIYNNEENKIEFKVAFSVNKNSNILFNHEFFNSNLELIRIIKN